VTLLSVPPPEAVQVTPALLLSLETVAVTVRDSPSSSVCAVLGLKVTVFVVEVDEEDELEHPERSNANERANNARQALRFPNAST